MKHDWEYKKLGEVCEIINGKNQRNVESSDGEYPIMGSGGVMGYAKDYLCNAGTTIIGRKGTINRPIFVEEKFWNVDTAFGIQPKEGVSCKFIFYVCKSIDFTRYDKSVTIPSLVKSDLLKIPIPVPPLPIQQQIVAELDKVSEIIEKKKQQVKELDNLAQSIFYDMFGDPVENEKGWEVKKYGEVFIIGAGGTPSKSKPEYWEGGNIPWIGSNMCQNQIIYQTDGKYITDEGLSHSSAKVLEEGTVLVALVGATIGKVGLLKTKTATNQNIAFVKVGENLGYNPYFVYYQLQSLYGLFMSIGNGDFKMANQGFIKDLPIITPPLPLQQSFAQKVEAIEKQKELITASIKEAQLLFDARMDYWFGE